MPINPADGPCVALLGPEGRNLAHAVDAALLGLGCPPPRWLWPQAVAASQVADLRWLLSPLSEAPDELDALAEQQQLRAQLHEQELAYQVLRGSPSERLAQALQSLAPWRPGLRPHLPQVGVASRRPGRWVCDSCSEPACEHLDFQALVASRQA